MSVVFPPFSYTGLHCESDIDDCESSPCMHSGRCLDDVALYKCMCTPAWTGVNCQIEVNECTSSPCENGGLCIDMVGGYSCQCQSGYTGWWSDITCTV